MGLRSWLTTLSLGAGLMYLYDPQNGRRRRAELRDQWTHIQNETEDFWGKAQRDLENRYQGVQHQAQSLRERASNLPGMNGMPSGQGNMQENLRHAQQGVREGMQNARQTLQESAQDMTRGMGGQWSPGVRLLAGLAGGGMTFYGLTQRGLKGTAATLFGFNLLARGVANTGLRDLAGMGGQRSQGITFQKTLTVHAPLHEVYEFWHNYQNFPRFMSHVQEVRDLGNGRSHWVVDGPAGQTVEWDAVTTEMERDHVLAWESLPGAQVHNAGRVRFQPSGDNATRLDIFLSYRPPAGVIGQAVAAFFGTDPKSALDDDMVRFKSLLEAGKTTADGREVTKQDVSPRGGGQQASSQGGSAQHSGNRSSDDTQNTGAGRYSGGSQPSNQGTSGPRSTFSGPTDASSSQHGKSQAASVPGMNDEDTGITGGAGRVDEVGHTGVYPASDASAPGDAEAQGMASWGQGDLGAAGYEESGRSELHVGDTGVDDADLEAGSTGGFDSMMPGNAPDTENPDAYDTSEDD
jgi:uncharacterized membrane protein